jgi:head-tail adaptor
MRAGLLTEQITILTPELTLGTTGEQVTELKLKYTTKARILTNRRTRTTENGEVWSPTHRTIEIRRYHDIGDNDIICWNGTHYRILSIEDDRQQQCLRLEIDQVNE